MQTVSIHVSTLCVPCENRCRYCLLSWDGKLLGADYDRSQAYAEGFYNWLQKNRPELSFQFYYGYAMEHPHLTEAIDFAKKIGSVGSEFLQLDGLKFRSGMELTEWLVTIQTHGIRVIDLTFYGTQAYHDCFAGRKGDFSYMLTILEKACQLGLAVNISIPITAENADQMDELLDLFENFPVQTIRIFIPHREGRGASLEKVRLRRPEFEKLSSRVLSHINRARYHSEGEWITKSNFVSPQKRMLGLSLTPDNIEQFEKKSYTETIAYLEALDDAYYRILPSLEKMVALYGDPQGEKIFDQRDLYLYYQHRYIKENRLHIYDINDERQYFSRRF